MFARSRALMRHTAPVALVAALLGVAAPAPAASTTTPIKHLVVIYQENNSFDHYFGTYPNTNPQKPATFSAHLRKPFAPQGRHWSQPQPP